MKYSNWKYLHVPAVLLAGLLTFSSASAGSPGAKNDSGNFDTIAQGCPVSKHDVVVADIVGLRHAAAYSAPGTRIGVSGAISIDDDGQGDLMVTAADIEISCADNNAEIRGAPNSAVINIVADNVKVSWLKVSAEIGDGIISYARKTKVQRSDIACGRVCIFFRDAEGGSAKNNKVASGSNLYGIVVLDATNKTQIRNNYVSGCTETCIYVFESNSTEIVGNHTSDCGQICVFIIRSNDVTYTRNNCDNPSFFDFKNCVRVAGPLDNLKFEQNTIRGFVGIFGGFAPGAAVDNLSFRKNQLSDGNMFAYFLDNAVFDGNKFNNCPADDGSIPYCLNFGGHRSTDIVDNSFVSEFGVAAIFFDNRGGETGLENFQESTTIAENTIEMTGIPYPHTGIVFTGDNAYIADNSISLTPGSEGVGISLAGWRFSFYSEVNGEVVDDVLFEVIARGNYVGHNTVSGAPIGVNVEIACDNTFESNTLETGSTDYVFRQLGKFEFSGTDPDGNVGLNRFLYGGTGANTVITGSASAEPGNRIIEKLPDGAESVIADGYLDCNGDGVPDPNYYGS